MFTSRLFTFRYRCAFVKKTSLRPGADLGGAGCGGRLLPQGFDPLPTQRVPPLILFQKSIFGRPTDPKIFLKAPWAPIYTNFEGERAPKNSDFFVKTAFSTVFSEFCLRHRKFSQNGGKKVLWESSKKSLSIF